MKNWLSLLLTLLVMLTIGFVLWLWLIQNNGIADVSNYVAGEEQIDSLNNASSKIEPTIDTPPTKPITQISVNNPNSSYDIYPEYLFFDFNKSSLTEENQLKLDRIYKCIHEDATYTLEADGYADQKGSDAYNLILSQKRAEESIDYLIQKGFPQGRIQVVAHGKQQSSNLANHAYKSIMSQSEFERRVELILKVNGKRVNLKDKIAALEQKAPPKPVLIDTAQDNLISKYHYLYRILHQEHQGAFDGDTLQLDKLQFITQDTLAEGVEVFGWHPYWMGDAYTSYSYNLLSTIAFFSYDVNPETGSYRTDEPINDWKTTALVDSAKATGSKILLTVTNHGYSNNKQLLDNEQVQNVLIDSLIYLVSLRGGDGVDIDFEVIPKGYKDKLSKFIQRLSENLKAKNPNSIISLDIPAVDHFESFDIEALDEYVDLFVVMGYDYHGTTGLAGPISPLPPDKRASQKDGVFDLPTTLKHYSDKGLKRSKMIMALPHYGGVWTYEDSKRKPGSETFDTYLAYRDVQAKYSDSYTANYDTASTSFYYDVVEDGLYKRCWFDNEVSLGKKYTWVNREGLRGIGIWALGYDNGYTELWKGIGMKYTKEQIANQPWTLADFLIKYRSLLIACIAFLLLFALIGFLLSLFDWRVREVLFYSPTFQIFYTILLVFLASMLLWLLDIIDNRVLIFILGLLIGWVVTSVVKKILVYKGRYVP